MDDLKYSKEEMKEISDGSERTEVCLLLFFFKLFRRVVRKGVRVVVWKGFRGSEVVRVRSRFIRICLVKE